MNAYVGIDLHSSNSVVGIIDENNKQLFLKKLPNNLDEILLVLEQFKNIIIGIVVESTFNWYWLVDGLLEKGYPTHLSNPCANRQCISLKYSDDKKDSLWLVNLLMFNILKEGYINPKMDRSARVLLCRRMMFVQQRTVQILSFQSMITRNNGVKKSCNDFKKLKPEDAVRLFDDSHLVTMTKCYLETIRNLTNQIRITEKDIIRSKTNEVVATKVLANKLAQATTI